jgi:hypothetical protein
MNCRFTLITASFLVRKRCTNHTLRSSRASATGNSARPTAHIDNILPASDFGQGL